MMTIYGTILCSGMALLIITGRARADLRVLACEQPAANLGKPSLLIHTVKEMGSLLIDQQLSPDTLLTRRFKIHGTEVGIKPNDIFTSFVTLGNTLARYVESFGFLLQEERQTPH
jgi:hypothetical protein